MAAASLGAEARSTSPRTVITGGSVTSEMLYPNAAGSFILLLCDEPRGPVGPGVCRPPREIASEPHGRGARLPGRAHGVAGLGPVPVHLPPDPACGPGRYSETVAPNRRC